MSVKLFEKQEQITFEANWQLGGEFTEFAEYAVGILASTVLRADRSQQLFMAHYSQVRKASILAFLSALRMHKVQSSLNLRLAIEGTVLMTYALANPSPPALSGMSDLTDGVQEKLTKDARAWLTATYPAYSEKLKLLKDEINSSDSHANLVNTYATFDFGKTNEPMSLNRFFDREDDGVLRVSLWTVGHTVSHIVGAMVRAAVDHPGIEIADDYEERLTFLSKMNDRLLANIQEDPRWADLFVD